jgi:hypothetical protein
LAGSVALVRTIVPPTSAQNPSAPRLNPPLRQSPPFASKEPASKLALPAAFPVSGNFVYVPSNIFRDNAGNAIAQIQNFNAASINGSREEDK